MTKTTKNEAFHQRLALLIGTEEPFRWAKRMEIPSATFARIWNDHDIPKHDHLCRIAKNCNVSLDWLLLGYGKSDSANISFAVMPLIGLASCGIAQGWFNESDLTGHILLPSFLAEEDAFAVVCRGKSMVPAKIADGNVCIVYPNRPVEIGKPVLVRTKTFVKGKEIALATIKLFDSQDEDSVSLSGWLDPDETGYQSLFTEKRLKNSITMLAPVGNILQISLPESALHFESAVDKSVLTECLDTLKPLYGKTDSKKFADMVLFLYDDIMRNGRPNMKTINRLAEMMDQKNKQKK